jgi:hypothetical protein
VTRQQIRSNRPTAPSGALWLVKAAGTPTTGSRRPSPGGPWRSCGTTAALTLATAARRPRPASPTQPEGAAAACEAIGAKLPDGVPALDEGDAVEEPIAATSRDSGRPLRNARAGLHRPRAQSTSIVATISSSAADNVVCPGLVLNTLDHMGVWYRAGGWP